MVRRYFHRYMNDKHYNKKWRKEMGGRTYMDEGFVRGEVPVTHTIQDSIDTLNAAIDRLDGIIKEMQDNCECKN
jgi:hypothetical protein